MVKLRDNEQLDNADQPVYSGPAWRARPGLDPGLVALILLAAGLVVLLAHRLAPAYEAALQWLEETINIWLGW